MTPATNQGFYGLGIAPKLLDTLDKLHFTVPTPIQEKSIPIAIEGNDIIGVAQTGTGKTLAFGIPMLQRLAISKGVGLIVLPTRELAIQVDEALHGIGTGIGLRTAVLIGGASMNMQVNAIRRDPHVIVATPGRLLDHLEQKTIGLSKVAILVLDEADRMLDMGFAPQIRRILAVVPKDRQTMLFSATMPADIVKIAQQHMKLPLQVEVAPSGTAAERVEHELYVVPSPSKNRLLETVLGNYHGTVLVFTRTKHGAKKLTRFVKHLGNTAAEIHSNRSLAQRRDALEGFKKGAYRVLIATDIAARGIDVTGIELVINYDLPSTAEDYIHRIGRTGRAGLAGKAISFAMPDQRSDVFAIERLLKMRLPVTRLPELPPDRVVPMPKYDDDRGVRSFRGGGRPPRSGGGRPSFGGGRGGQQRRYR